VADAQRDTHAAGFKQLVGLIDGLRGEHTIAMLKSDIAAKAPSAVQDAIGAVGNLGQNAPCS